MVKQFLLIIGFLFSIQVMSQTGIGTTTPHASAKLDVSATNKGFFATKSYINKQYLDISPQSLPLISLDSLPAFHSKVYH
jgi:hypothetical protein